MSDWRLIDTQFANRPKQVAVYLLKNKTPLIVDAGTEYGAEEILKKAEVNSIKKHEISKILITHIHLDHAGGVKHISGECPNAEVFCGEQGKKYLTDSDQAVRLVESAHSVLGELAGCYGGLQTISSERVRSVEPGHKIQSGDRTIRVLSASGHASHQLSFYDTKDSVLFPGDEAGVLIDGTLVPATPPPEFDLQETLRSLDQFISLEPEIIALPHFGFQRDTEKHLKQYKSLLKNWVSEIEQLSVERENMEAIVDKLLERGVPHSEVWAEETARKIVRVDVSGVLSYLNEKNG